MKIERSHLQAFYQSPSKDARHPTDVLMLQGHEEQTPQESKVCIFSKPWAQMY